MARVWWGGPRATSGPTALDGGSERPYLVRRRAAPLPAIPVDDLVEGPSVGPADRSDRSVGRVAERDEQGAVPVLGVAQQPPGQVLVGNGRVAASDPQVGRGEHDAHRRL